MRKVFVIGFMASGKTTVGRALARALGLPFVDLDERIESEAGMSVADIFAAESEAGFRRRERAALDAVVAEGAAVIATGGGTPCLPGALDQMRSAGAVVALHAPFDALRARVDDPASRPMLARPVAALRELYDARLPVYRQAHFGVDVQERDVADVVRATVDALGAFDRVPDDARAASTVVALGRRSYPIVVAPGVLHRIGEFVDGYTAAAIVTDEHVAPHYLDRLRARVERAGVRAVEVVIPAGEEHKTLATAGSIAERLVAAGLDRGSVVIALGGGVVGDIAGFVAAMLFRGVDLVQVPTTLLAMIDSSIGGKTGVDLPAGKNLVGAFWQPKAVVADTDTLATLPARELRAAVGELVKYALLDSEEMLALCERLDPTDATLIRRCATFKAWTVSRDEREVTGERAVLNLGHTIGHAIEVAAGYGTLLHGECVALGLVAACRVSAALGLCDPALERRVAALLSARGLDVDVDRWLRPDVLAHVAVDKKRRGDAIRFVAIERPGAPVVKPLKLDELSGLLYD
ncbi:MAG: 3-dehydroquinate synthase [Deltaproteobacteria bacterium]|nr:MAG: 3-dehydroquinate synthase [Deltaproteobacteria bacterium]